MDHNTHQLKCACVALALFSLANVSWASPRAPIEERLLRTIHTGVAQDVTIPEILAYARVDTTPFAGHVLARSALHVLGEDRGFPDWPLDKLLERTLTMLQPHSFPEMPHLPDHFENEELVFSTVYALVVSGEQDKAIQVLGRQLQINNKYSQAVALQALRNIGSPEANALIQEFLQKGDDHNLAENLLADLHYPFWIEVQKRWALIPRQERERQRLHAMAAEGCGERSALAVYLLGFFPPAESSAQENAELSLFRSLSEFRSHGCFHSRFFAIRTLALRSPETVEFWVKLFRKETDGWQRGNLVQIGFGRFGRDFLKTALELLRTEPVQYVQWELMHGNIEVREGARFRDYWDIWFPVGLQLRLNFPVHEQRRRMSEQDLQELLDWLERNRPLNDVVRNHMLYGLAEHVQGQAVRRFLRIFNALADRNRNWWILWNIPDAQVLPLLRYYLTVSAPEEQQSQLTNLIERLENKSKERRGQPGDRCCQPTEECLLAHVRPKVREPEASITTEAEARAWLQGQESSAPPIKLEFLDPLQRVAETLVASQPSQRWEFLYGCWQYVEQPSKDAGAPRGILGVTSLPQADTNLVYLGAFSNVDSTGEHLYGFTIHLWREGDSLIGLFESAEGLEGDTPAGVFENVKYGVSTGELSFRAKLTIGQHDPSTPSRDLFEFRGTLDKKRVAGLLAHKDALHPDRPLVMTRIVLPKLGGGQSFIKATSRAEWDRQVAEVLKARGPKW